MKKILKYILIALVIGLVGYKSVYFKKLSEVKKTAEGNFDAAVYANKIWEEKLPARLDSAIELTSLVKLIETNAADAFGKYSNVMGIGNYRYSLVKVKGVAAVINEDDIVMRVNQADSFMLMKLETEYIYGNAIRDASGLFDLKSFNNTADLNSISEELNKKVRTSVLPAFKSRVKKGDLIEVTAAVEFNKEHISFSELELIPVRVKMVE